MVEANGILEEFGEEAEVWCLFLYYKTQQSTAWLKIMRQEIFLFLGHACAQAHRFVDAHTSQDSQALWFFRIA